MLEGAPTTHDAATLSAPLKVPHLLICISKQAADNFKVSTPMRPDAGMDLCLSMCVGMCVSGFIYLCVCVYVCVCVCVCVCVYVQVCIRFFFNHGTAFLRT